MTSGTKIQHAPGPWRAYPETLGGQSTYSIWDAEDNFLAGENIAEVRFANARLIAAAPEMLELLRRVIHHYETDNDQLAVIVEDSDRLISRLEGAK